MCEKSNDQKAIEILKKYRRTRWLTLLLYIMMGIAIIICTNYTLRPIFCTLCIVSLVSFLYLVGMLQNRKIIWTVLVDSLDAPLYAEIIKRGKLYVTSGINQIQAEYSVGNYENVIAACNAKLSDKRAAKRYKYYYLYYLAACYFDVGDEPKFNEVCNRIYQAPDFERRRKRLYKRIPSLEFYDAYIKRDLLYSYMYIGREERRTHHNLDRTSIKFKKARVLMLDGKSEQASKLLEEIVSEAPDINYAAVSARALEAMGAGEEYSSAFEELKPNADFAVVRLAHKAVGLKIMAVAGIVCIIVSTAIALLTEYAFWQQKRYDEQTRVLLEQDYDGVEIIDRFTLETGKETVDTMFVAKSESELLVGSTYVYSEDDSGVYYEIQLNVALASLADIEWSHLSYGFESVVTDYYVSCEFYFDEASIPDNNFYSVLLPIGDKPIYFVITNVEYLG